MQTSLGNIESIPPGEGREFQVAGTTVAVFRLRSGEVYATQASCPHRNAPLCDGITGGTTLVCPFHSWKFDLRTGETLTGNESLKTYPITLGDDGSLSVTVSEAVPAGSR